MKTTNERLIDWVIGRIKTDYADEVGLLIGESAYKLEKDASETALSLYFPASEKANSLAKTFIIEGIGYDLFPMSWERLERIAGLDEDIAPSLLDAKILYSSSEADRKRFLDLQDRLRNNLHNTQYTLNRALEKLSAAMEIFQTMLFEKELYKVRKAAGYILNFLSTAVAYTNLTYFKHGHDNQLEDLSAMAGIPADFTRLYQAVVKAGSNEELKKLCYEIINNTRQYLSAKKGKREKASYNRNFKHLADWYQELSYAWREVYYWCDRKDAVRAFMRGSFLQCELDIIQAEFGLAEFDLLGAFRADDLTAYRKRAETLEKRMVSLITEQGVAIEAYDSVDDFLAKNG
jgi:hypothetical protein